ncbi:MAG TPA: DUF3817 domain-containing protein [Pseudonocardiaceae bacterium]|nr:DUF3817 domain-containing protein [Pseudonocardiaceae bacterium]
MSSPRTTPTSPGSPKRTIRPSKTSVPNKRIATWLVGYRITAYATGVMLLVLMVSVVLHYGFADERLVWVGPVHGFLYLGYVVCTFFLGTSLGWRLGRMALVATAGMIPLMSFVAERSVTREVRAGLANSTPSR